MLPLSILTTAESPAVCSTRISQARAVSACLTSFQAFLFHNLVQPPVEQLCWTHGLEFHKWIQNNSQARSLWKEVRHGLKSKWETYSFIKELGGEKSVYPAETSGWLTLALQQLNSEGPPLATLSVMQGVLGKKESKLPSSVPRENSVTNHRQVIDFQAWSKASWCTQSHPGRGSSPGRKGVRQEWANQQMTLQIPQWWHSQCLQNICLQAFTKPAYRTHPRLFY